jgi:hypothetical protein
MGLKTVSASVENSLFADGQKAGIHPTLLSQLADIFMGYRPEEKFEKGIASKYCMSREAEEARKPRPLCVF